MHGHMLGATGAVEGIVCVKTITDGKVPPTINLDNQDEHVANLDYVPHKAREKKVHAALSNSFGFGGHNATLVFKEDQFELGKLTNKRRISNDVLLFC